MSVFDFLDRPHRTSAAELADSVDRFAKSRPGQNLLAPSVAGRLVAMEGLDEGARGEVRSAASNLKASLESFANDSAGRSGARYATSQVNAGTIAGMVAANVGAWRQPRAAGRPALEANTTYSPASGGAVRQAALEAYDERDNRHMTGYSVAFNMEAAAQDEFGEAFFPTVTVSPDQLGLSVTINLVQVYEEIRRTGSGSSAPYNFGRKNLAFALIDGGILKNDVTKIVPVLSTETAKYFVLPSLVPPRVINTDGFPTPTAPLKMGAEFDLIDISTTEALVRTGTLDSTDALDPALNLDALYMEFITGGTTPKSSVIRFDGLINFQGAHFVPAAQGLERRMTLAWNTVNLVVSGATTAIDGSAIPALKPIADNKFIVRLKADIYGNVDLQTSRLSIQGGGVSNLAVFQIEDRDGNSIDLTTGIGATIAGLFDTASLLGYDLNSRRVNTNRRQRGKLLDSTNFTQIYEVPLLSPITIPRPLTENDQREATDLSQLILATHVMTSNMAVDKLFELAISLNALAGQQAQNGGANNSIDPEFGGVSRLVLKPYFADVEFVAPARLNSLTAEQRMRDVKATLVNFLRAEALRAYNESGYKAAQSVLYGPRSKKPRLVIGVDQITEAYLNIDSPLTDLGGGFDDVLVVSSINKQMLGVGFMVFQPAGDESGLDPLGFGNMAWKPELVTVLPLHRNGGNSKETTVQPSLRHIVKTPVMVKVRFVGLQDAAAAKTTIDFHQV